MSQKSAKSLEISETVALPVHQERSRETRDRLLAAAEQAFAAKGYEKARIADIARAAGVSPGAVYFRFKDKEALFNGVVERFAEDGRYRVAKFGEGRAPGDWKAIVRRLMHTTWGLFHAHRGMLRAIMERGAMAPQAFLPIVPVRLEISRLLIAAMAGRFDPARRDLKMQVAMQMIFGFVLTSLSSPISVTQGHGGAAIDEAAAAVIAYLEHTK